MNNTTPHSNGEITKKKKTQEKENIDLYENHLFILNKKKKCRGSDLRQKMT
jgi:hypothetical protein